MEDFSGLKYSDLQKLAKKYGIKANQKGDQIIAALKEISGEQITLEFSSEGEKECPTTTDSEPEEKGKSQKSRKNRKGQKKKNPTKTVEHLTSEDECTTDAPKKTRRFSKTPKYPDRGSSPSGVKITAKKTPQESKSASGKYSAPAAKQRTLSTSQTNQGSLKTSSTKKLRSTPGSAKRGGSQNASFTKTHSQKELMTEDADEEEKAKDIKELMTEDEDDEITIRPRRSRSYTYTRDAPSPNVQHLLASMHDDMTEDQRKQSLMNALDKNTKNNSKGKTVSNIPRFTGLTGKMEPAQEVKQRTPGKDWAKIHKRQWDKMDSLDEYLAKKRKRTESVSQSVKKLKLMTEQITSNMQNRKQLSTPGSSVKQTKTSLFESPKQVPFKPKATSTSEINLNFAKTNNEEKIVLKGNSTTAGKVGRKSSDTKIPKAVNTLFTIGHGGKRTSQPHRRSKENSQRKVSLGYKSRPTPSRSETTANRRVTVATPGKQCHNSAADRTYTVATPANTGMNSATKFDLEASLAKPIGWKPHKGQLKPFSFGNLHNLQTNYKEAKVKSRDDRRKEAVQRRNDKKSNLQMSRRGITVSD